MTISRAKNTDHPSSSRFLVSLRHEGNSMISTKLGPIRQIAYVVPDAEAAASMWIEQFGAGPFFKAEKVRLPGWTYLGQPQDMALDLVMGQLDGVMIELLLPYTREPSVYSHAFADGPVLHHYGLLVDNLEEATTLIGVPPLTTGTTMAGTPFSYNDTRSTLGVIVELIEARDDVRAIFDLIAGASKGWDGRDPLRALTL
jgi:methylmalonyl-CoA/ethylmalonyl-CoA epimerase